MINFIITYWLEVIFGIILSLITVLWQNIKTYHKKMESIKSGVKILLKNEITNYYDEAILKNSITLFEKEMLIELYKQYKNLEGNGLIENLIEKIDTIPLKNGGD
jgi:hypothetical protein